MSVSVYECSSKVSLKKIIESSKKLELAEILFLILYFAEIYPRTAKTKLNEFNVLIVKPASLILYLSLFLLRDI